MKSFVPMMCLAIICLATSCKKSIDSQAELSPIFLQSTPHSASTDLNNDLMLKLVNDTRLAGCNCGATVMPPVGVLTWNDNLTSAAITHSKFMQSINKMQHEAADGTGVGNRATASGYVWRAVGENIAHGQTTEQQVFNDWLKSEGHCKNMMNANFKETGAARSGTFWTQVFAAKM